MGDFNAELDCDNSGLESIMGHQEIGQTGNCTLVFIGTKILSSAALSSITNRKLYTGFCRNVDLVIGRTNEFIRLRDNAM